MNNKGFPKLTVSKCMILRTTNPHDILKHVPFDVIDTCFFNKQGTQKYTYLASKNYFMKPNSDSTQKYLEFDIKKWSCIRWPMFKFSQGNIYLKVFMWEAVDFNATFGYICDVLFIKVLISIHNYIRNIQRDSN